MPGRLILHDTGKALSIWLLIRYVLNFQKCRQIAIREISRLHRRAIIWEPDKICKPWWQWRRHFMAHER